MAKTSAKKAAAKTSAKTPAKKVAAKHAPKAKKVAAKKTAKPVAAKPAKTKVKEKVKLTLVSSAPAQPRGDKVKAPDGASEELKKWYDMRNKHGNENALPYSMSGVYESNRPIVHKVLGWGWITSVQNDRLEVLFEEGIKHLISNYKPR